MLLMKSWPKQNQHLPVFHKNHETGKEDFYFMKLNQFYDDIVEYHSLHELLIAFMMHGERERVKQRK